MAGESTIDDVLARLDHWISDIHVALNTADVRDAAAVIRSLRADVARLVKENAGLDEQLRHSIAIAPETSGGSNG